jgi:hypothetical protein
MPETIDDDRRHHSTASQIEVVFFEVTRRWKLEGRADKSQDVITRTKVKEVTTTEVMG